MKKIINTFGRLLVVLSIIFLLIKFNQHIGEIPDFTWGLGAVLSLFAGILFIAGVLALSAYAWAILLRGGGVSLTLRRAYIIMGQIQIGKYLPGNVFHYIGRFALARRYGIPSEAIMLSIGVETFLVIVTAIAIAIAGLALDNRAPTWLIEELGTKRFSTILAGFALLATISTIMAIFLPYIRTWIRPRLAYLHIGRVSASILLYLIAFALFGIFISILLKTLWAANVDLEWYQLTWGFALAWVLGFITPGSPGGIGIREIVFVSLYGKELGEGLAIGLAVVLRVITSMGDLLAFLLAYWLGKQESI